MEDHLEQPQGKGDEYQKQKSSSAQLSVSGPTAEDVYMRKISLYYVIVFCSLS